MKLAKISPDKIFHVYGVNFLTIMVATKRPHICIPIDSLLGVRYIEIDINTASGSMTSLFSAVMYRGDDTQGGFTIKKY